MNPDELWQAVLGELQVSLSTASFNTWFKNTRLLAIGDDGKVIVAVPSVFIKEWLEKRTHQQLLEILGRLSPGVTDIEYRITTINPPAAKVDLHPAREPQPSLEPSRSPVIQTVVSGNIPLRPDYTFEQFVVGSSNRLAYATALAVAKDPGRRHNPLFIYGGAGLGKTHLMHAIGNALVHRSPQLRILYVSCEDFANEFIHSLQHKTIDSFKKKYRNTGVFLVDDIQFLARKEGTQEEFFHTFNALHQGSRQIVLTADRLPKDIPTLETRLSSRLTGGMVADIQPPNFETRLAIINQKTQDRGWPLDEKVANFLASSITSNIRELEGALNRLLTYCQLSQIAPTVDVAVRNLKDFIAQTEKQKPTPRETIERVAQFFGLTREDIISPRRNRTLTYPRQIIMYLLRHELNLSYKLVGQELGGRDHTTVLYGIGQIERGLSRNETLKSEINLIKEKVFIQPEIHRTS